MVVVVVVVVTGGAGGVSTRTEYGSMISQMASSPIPPFDQAGMPEALMPCLTIQKRRLSCEPGLTLCVGLERFGGIG